jgi:hypothetical protein
MMKTRSLFVLAGLALCSSCLKEQNSYQHMWDAAKTQIQGSWKIDSVVQNHYLPGNQFLNTERFPGASTDSLYFGMDRLLSVHSQYLGNRVVNYDVVDATQVMIGDTVWQIKALNNRKLMLMIDLNDAAQSTRLQELIYMGR